MGALQDRMAGDGPSSTADPVEPVPPLPTRALPLGPEVFVELVAASPDAKLVLDPSGRILYANAQAVRMVGALDRELVGQHAQLLLPTRLHARFAALARAWCESPRPLGMGELENTYLRLADGSECPVEVSITPVESAGLPLVAVAMRDLRAQRLAEGRFREMLEAAPDAMVVVDDLGEVVFANTRACEMFRCPAEDLVGSGIDRFVPVESRAGHAARRRRFLADGRARPMGGATRQLFAERLDGTRFPVDVSLSMLSWGEDHMVVAAVRDASEREALRSEAQRLRDQLMATVSHELRTPLASIIGYTEMLSELGEEHLSATARQMLEVIAKNAAREHKLVNDLLAASHESVTERLDLMPVDLRSVVAGAAQQAAPGAAAAGVAVEVDPQEERIAVLADLQRVRQLTESLLDNAVKFSPEGGRVTLSVRYEEHSGVLRIADGGVGMSPREIDLACERLYRAPVAVEEQFQGAGLGLTLARDIVHAHGGAIGIDSEPGAGTTVTVTLPIGGPA